MKILLYGNTNNMPLLLAEGLRGISCEVTLIVNRKEQLHRPEGLDHTYVNYPDWIMDWSEVSWQDIKFGSRLLEQGLAELTETVDYAILNDIGPSLYSNVCCPFAILGTGSDITWYAKRSTAAQILEGSTREYQESKRGRIQRTKIESLIERQRKGIRRADIVFAPPKAITPDLGEILDDIGVARNRRHFLYLSDTERITSSPVPSGSPLRILSAARLSSTISASPALSFQDEKGTEILLAGMKMFSEQGHTAKLLLPEKGNAIVETEKLVDKLGLASLVEWYEETTQSEFYEKIRSSHLVVDSVGKSFPGLSYTAAIASGRCVLANLYPNKIPYKLPGLHADRSEDVAASLVKVDNDRQYLQEISAAGAHFAKSQLSPKKQAEKALQLIQAALQERKTRAYRWKEKLGFTW
jgi:glycosyltransferase involved in cell wall biosynthesis